MLRANWIHKIMVYSFICFFALCSTSLVYADDANSSNISEKDIAAKKLSDIMDSALDGPVQIALSDQAILDLPQDYAFVSANDAADVVALTGHKVTPALLGVVVNKDKQLNWFITVSYFKSGYVKSDINNLGDENVLLYEIQKSIDRNNSQRYSEGRKPLTLQGWLQVPYLDSINHIFSWSVATSDGTGNNLVRYNVYVLGRRGYVELVLIAPNNEIGKDISYINRMARAITFNSGYHYEDYIEATDHTADFQLKDLVLESAYNPNFLTMVKNFFLNPITLIFIIFVLSFPTLKQLFRKKK